MKFKNFITDAISYAKQTSDDITSHLDEIDGEFYAEAEEEIDNGAINRGLWSKALVKARGDENVRKSIYIGLRAKQLKVEEVDKKKLEIETNKLFSARLTMPTERPPARKTKLQLENSKNKHQSDTDGSLLMSCFCVFILFLLGVSTMIAIVVS